MVTGTQSPPPAYTRYSVPSRERPGVRYIVEQDMHGRWSCSCPAKAYPKTAGRCWHLRACQAGVIAPSARAARVTHATWHASSPITVLAAVESAADRVNRLMYDA